MNAIWKFPLTAEETEIEAPIEHFLTVQMQGDTPCVWAIVNPDKTPRKYKVVIIGTGWECQRIDASKYIGTVQAGMYVWHSLRHTHATMLAEAGMPQKYTQHRLGHKDISVTLKYYTHLTDKMSEIGGKILESMFADNDDD